MLRAPLLCVFFSFFPRPEIKISVILQQLAALSSRVFSFNCAPSQLYLFFFLSLILSFSCTVHFFHDTPWTCTLHALKLQADPLDRPPGILPTNEYEYEGCRLTHFLNADICGHITSLAYRALRADGRQALDKCQTLNIFLALPTDPLRCLSPKHFPVM